MKVGLEKVDTHEGVMVEALLDSGATGLFMNKEFVDKNGFRMEKLERPVKVMNIDGTHNKGGDITHEVTCNIFYKGHRERARFDVCNLGRTEVILEMPWLAVHNPEIDWEKGKVELTRCPPWYGKSNEGKERVKPKERMRGTEEEKAISWTADKKEDWGREEEMEIDHRKIETMVPKRYHEPPLWLSPFLLFFSLLFSFLFIAWESLSRYVTQGVTMSHKTVTSRSRSHVTRSHDGVGK